jgi:hypothetical protein
VILGHGFGPESRSKHGHDAPPVGLGPVRHVDIRSTSEGDLEFLSSAEALLDGFDGALVTLGTRASGRGKQAAVSGEWSDTVRVRIVGIAS